MSRVDQEAREVFERLKDSITGAVGINFPIGPLTTMRVGGSASLYIEPEDLDDLESLRSAIGGTDLRLLVIGRGSNLLVSDSGFAGVALRLGAGFNWIELWESGVSAGAAMPLPNLSRWAGERGLGGIEFGVGIPASVGGAVRMNAGGHGKEIREVLVDAEVFDLRGENQRWTPADLDFSYRRSAIPTSGVVISARFALEADDPEAIRGRMTEISKWRRENQPGGSPNAGSMFKNPPGDAAGRLIEEAGLKGLRVGGAQVAEKHANFILADAGAKASDVFDLMLRVREAVLAGTGVELEPEVAMVGDFPRWPEPATAAGGAS